MGNPVLIRITTVPISLEILLSGQMKFMQEHGFEVYMISSSGNNTERLEKRENCRFIPVEMTRTISPEKDFISLYQLIKQFRKIKPAIVHTHTPKAGFLGMIAAWLCRIPIRLHTVAGLPLMETKGIKKQLLICVEKITYACASFVYPNSFELKKYIVDNNFASLKKLKVFGNGSSNGIDINYFKKTDTILNQAAQIRTEFSISSADVVFIFIGRIVKDKGINELVKSFNTLHQKYNHIKLFLVGSFEDELDPIDISSKEIINQNKNIICLGFINDIRPYLAASDVLVLPSYREGFPNVPLQAGCFELPLIVTDINGCNEIVHEGINGLLVRAKNTEALYSAMEKMITDENLRKKLADCSRQLIVENYSREKLWNELLDEYIKLLHNKGIKLHMYQKFLKPLFDLVFAVCAFTLTFPFFLICILILSFANNGRPFFFQLRPGKNNKIFRLIKFKTMNDKKDIKGNLLPDAKRLTTIGKFIRKTSLDEIPQLLNVIKGDMSVVGPRPLLIEYLPLYNPVEKRRHEVKPGITGWAQVNGRNAIGWKQKFEYDVWYVDHLSFALDMKILFRTFIKVSKSEGISAQASATMEKFTGNTE